MLELQWLKQFLASQHPKTGALKQLQDDIDLDSDKQRLLELKKSMQDDSQLRINETNEEEEDEEEENGKQALKTFHFFRLFLHWNVTVQFTSTQQGRKHGHQLRTGGQGRKCAFSHFSTRSLRTNGWTDGRTTDG